MDFGQASTVDLGVYLHMSALFRGTCRRAPIPVGKVGRLNSDLLGSTAWILFVVSSQVMTETRHSAALGLRIPPFTENVHTVWPYVCSVRRYPSVPGRLFANFKHVRPVTIHTLARLPFWSRWMDSYKPSIAWVMLFTQRCLLFSIRVVHVLKNVTNESTKHFTATVIWLTKCFFLFFFFSTSIAIYPPLDLDKLDWNISGYTETTRTETRCNYSASRYLSRSARSARPRH